MADPFGITKNSVEGRDDRNDAETFSDEATRRGDAAMNALPPRSYSKGDETFSEERDRRGAEIMSGLPPRKFRPNSPK